MNIEALAAQAAEQPALLWAAAAVGGALLVYVIARFAPAWTTILVDTQTSTARADMRVLWGLGPRVSVRALPRTRPGDPITLFNDPARVGDAFLTPGIADVTIAAVQRLMALKPRVAQASLGVNTGDSAKDRVVQTAVQAALAMAPASMTELVALSRCEAPGAEISAKFELMASPAQVASIWNGLRQSKQAREFIRRLTRKTKPVKKPVREVRAT